MYESYRQLSKSELGIKLVNFTKLKALINFKLPIGVFHIKKDQMMLQLIDDGDLQEEVKISIIAKHGTTSLEQNYKDDAENTWGRCTLRSH